MGRRGVYSAERERSAFVEGEAGAPRGDAIADLMEGNAGSIELDGSARRWTVASRRSPANRTARSSPHPVSVERSVAASPCHASTTVWGRISPPARANRWRAGTSAALWNRPAGNGRRRRRDAHIATALLQEHRGADPAPIADVVEQEHTTADSTPASSPSSSTSSIVATLRPSTPGSRSLIGAARWKPARAGEAPVATMTTSAPAAAIHEPSTRVSSRRSTPS